MGKVHCDIFWIYYNNYDNYNNYNNYDNYNASVQAPESVPENVCALWCRLWYYSWWRRRHWCTVIIIMHYVHYGAGSGEGEDIGAL